MTSPPAPGTPRRRIVTLLASRPQREQLEGLCRAALAQVDIEHANTVTETVMALSSGHADLAVFDLELCEALELSLVQHLRRTAAGAALITVADPGYEVDATLRRLGAQPVAPAGLAAELARWLTAADKVLQ